MKKRKFTNGGFEVSEIGTGCMGFSHGYGQVPEEEYSITAIKRAHDEGGCTFFDTAESYGDVVFYSGHNEQLVGKALEPFRKDIILATKLRVYPEELEGGTSVFDAVRKHLEKSMKNLRTDYVDLYYLHRIDNRVPFEYVAEAMGRLIEEGVISGWGMSQVDVDTIAKAHSVTPLTAVQNIYSMVERDCEKAVFPERKRATNTQISLAWMLHKYPNVVPIPGSKNQERILENLGAADVELTDEEFNALQTALDACTVHGHRGQVESVGHGFGNNWNPRS